MSDDARDDQGPSEEDGTDAPAEVPTETGAEAASGSALDHHPETAVEDAREVESEPEGEGGAEPEPGPEAEDAIEPGMTDWEEETDEVATEAAGPTATGARRQAARMAAVPTSIAEQAVHIDDRISAIYVLAAIAVFVAILLYGIVAGNGGLLTSPPSPSPSPSPVPSASAEPSPSP
jgi:hypothetical protein